jgi:hypothetical protein
MRIVRKLIAASIANKGLQIVFPQDLHSGVASQASYVRPLSLLRAETAFIFPEVVPLVEAFSLPSMPSPLTPLER